MQACPPLPERLLQAGLCVLQPGLRRQGQPLRAPPLHAGLQLPEAEGGPPEEPGGLRLQPLPPQPEEEEEEEDEDGLWLVLLFIFDLSHVTWGGRPPGV